MGKYSVKPWDTEMEKAMSFLTAMWSRADPKLQMMENTGHVIIHVP